MNPIAVGLGLPVDILPVPAPKRQTIRADRKRHARPGEQLQLYCGMRTKGCFLIGRAVCTRVGRVRLDFEGMVMIDSQSFQKAILLDEFARRDGFDDFADMREFWKREHDGVRHFEGPIIFWEPVNV